MAREKKPVHKVVMTEGKRNIIQQLLQEYDIQSAEDIQEALKDLLGGTIREMMEAEMDEHLGYQKSQRSDSDDYRNGYKSKRINSSYGTMDIQVPQDRKLRLSHMLSTNVRKISPPLTRKSSPCMLLKEISYQVTIPNFRNLTTIHTNLLFSVSYLSTHPFYPFLIKNLFCLYFPALS